MKNLLVWQKLTLLGAVFLLPLIAVTWAYVSSVNTMGIQTAEQEIRGVEYARSLLALLRDLQQRRGLVAAIDAGGDALRNVLDSKTTDVERGLADFDATNSEFGPRLQLERDGREIIGRCRELLAQSSASAAAHSDVISAIGVFLPHVADNAALTLDPELPTYYLQDLVITQLPRHAENVGRAWVRAAEARSGEPLSATTRDELRLFTAIIDHLHWAVNDSLRKAVTYAEDARQDVQLMPLDAMPQDDPLKSAVDRGVVEMLPIPFFHAMTVRLVADYELAEKAGVALQRLLDDRIVRHRGSIRTALLWSVLGLGAVSVMGWGIIRDITRSLGGLVATARAITGGAKDATVNLPPRADEIGELAVAFDGMLTAQRESREKLVSGNIELLSANEKLESARLEADAANRAKRDFLAVMSHEIRTPMNGILGMTELTLNTALNPTQREYLEMARGSAESLLLLLNDLLDFSKIEAGKLELDRAPFDLRDALGDTMHTLALRAQEKGIELALHIRPDVPDALFGDAFRLRQVVVNLVGNAIKFTDAGEIAVRVENAGTTDGMVALNFTVRDTGIGIPKEAQAKIFDAFSQADISTTRRFGGTGLGLAIASQIVGLMGGRIELESAEGKGSTFRFTARFAMQSARPVSLPAELESVRVLVVDDNATNRLILREMFTSWRMEVLVAESARDALATLETTCAEGRPVSLVVTDLMMPDMDGFEFVSRMRKESALRETRVVMVTSANRAGDADRCTELGIGAHLAKPVKHSTLMDAIVDVLGPTGQTDRTAQLPLPNAAPAQRPLRILLAEDNKVNQRLAVANLESWGHQVTIANDGQEAVEISGRESFDLILMDSQMPRMSGFQAAAAIRERERGGARRMPIIAITASAMKGAREECLAAGMDGYVAKPIRREELIAAMAAVIPDLLTGAPPTASVAPSAPGPNEPSTFDSARALEAVGGNAGVLREMARLCLEDDAPRLFTQLREAVGRRDFSELEHAAHGIKGLVGEFRAERARQAAARVEEQGRAQNGDGLARLIADLEREFERFATEVRRL